MKTIATALVVIVAALFSTSCSTNVRSSAPGEDPAVPLEEARDQVRTMAQDTLRQLYARQPSAKAVVEGAAGYAVFSNFATKFLVTGGGSGKGIAVHKANGEEVFMRMAEVQAGLGFGINKYRQVWVFETQAAFDKFVDSGFEFGGQGTLAAKASGKGGGTAGAMSVTPGVWIYQLTDDGLAAELTVKGTKYYRDKGLN